MRNVPKLRFSGFSDEWEKKQLGDLCSVITKGTTPKRFEQTGVNFIKIECFNNGRIDKEKCLYISEENNNKELKRSILEERDILFAIAGATIGKCALVDKEILPANTNQALSILRLEDTINEQFILNILNSNIMKEYINSNISVGAQPNLNLEQMNKFTFRIPDTEEQGKIANFLIKVDKLIEKQDGKVSNLEQYKKGMMQKIFSQKIRFKKDDGGEYPEWENIKLEKIALKITEKNKEFRVQNIISNSAKNGLISQRDFFDKDIANKDNIDGYYIIEPGDFVYNPRKSNEAPYGPINSYRLNEEGVVSPLYFCFRVNKNVNKTYIEYYFKTTKWHRYVHMNSDQGARHDRVSIKDSEIMSINVELPSREEQTKIANFLSKIDSIVEKEKEKLEELKAWKKGLLQGMFV